MLKPRPEVEEAIENWDDDDLDFAGDDFAFRNASIATTTTNAPSHRDSISSRLSFRSDFDSNVGDEEKQVHLPEDDERSTKDAIAAASRAGIPLPQNVPSSALIGGTIKRLGGKKVKRVVQDDWDDDIELPKPGEDLKLKALDATCFPEALRSVSGPQSPEISPRTVQQGSVFNLGERAAPSPITSIPDLNKFRDDDDDDFFDGGATIKVAKSRPPRGLSITMPQSPFKSDIGEDDFEHDLQIPADGEPLRLTSRRDIPRTPNSTQDDFDWGEGSIGTRFGGTRRGQSNRSSSISALSPSVSSSITFESEDEGLDGLVLPTGPLNFEDILKKRRQNPSPIRYPEQRPDSSHGSQADDFLAGLDIGDGDVFESSRLTLNRNVKVKATRQMSPQRPKTAISLTFTNKPASVGSRLPRPQSTHERVPSSLAPVSESGGPIMSRTRRSQSRIGGHSTHSSLSSIPTPTTPSSTHSLPPSTPRRRDLAPKPSLNAIRNEPTTTSAQLLKLKRSMPIMRAERHSPARPMGLRYERPPSRTDSNRNSLSRPKTPVERERPALETSMSHLKKNSVPFLPAGASHSQSHHVTIKTSRHFRRNDSESSNELRPTSRTISRSTMRSPSPSRTRVRGADALAREATGKRQITKPVRRRHFGDGCELDEFDDLPTSANVEQQYVKQPVGRGAPKALLRNKLSQSSIPENAIPPQPSTPFSPFTPGKSDTLPRFARDTNASRMAREIVLSQRVVSGGAPMTTITNNWKAQVSARTGRSGPIHHSRMKRRNIPQQKPHLIKPLGNTSSNPRCKSSALEAQVQLLTCHKAIKGMVYNPLTYKWEGNENDMTNFDAPFSSPISSPHTFERKESMNTPRPALITNINASQGVQVVGGMVFDPQRMCWLKMAPSSTGKSESGDTMDGFDAFGDEEDVFKDVPDLEDSPAKDETGKSRKSEGPGAGTVGDDWLVGEEFDVGPEFVRRQREEEERWRRKCEKWLGDQRGEGEEWKWSIRDVVA
jgi:hypothetical protein